MTQDRVYSGPGSVGVFSFPTCKEGERVAMTGGRISPLTHDPAFTLAFAKASDLPVLIAVPHGGRGYFPDLLARMRAPDVCQLRLEDRHVDQLGEVVARMTSAALLRAHAPRAMLDLNRAETDIDWDMIDGPRQARPSCPTQTGYVGNHRARSGLGLIPRRLPGHGEIWRSRLPRAELDRRIADIHRPYHNVLANQLRQIRNEWGAALLIDLHSMPPLAVPDGQKSAPVMVVGDRFGASCHHALTSRALDLLNRQGVRAAPNRPYSGGYVLDRHGAPESGVHAIQIEVCRSLYLDDEMADLTKAAEGVAKLLAALVRELGRETAALGQARNLLEAAE